MKGKLSCSIVFLYLCGCGIGEHDSIPAIAAQARDARSLQEDWLLKYAALANKSTERTYQCISEMYSLAYHPVNSGPVCRDACKLVREVNDMVAKAPSYIVEPEKYAIGDSSVCQHKNRKTGAAGGATKGKDAGE